MRNLLIIGILVAFVESAWPLSYMGPPTSQMRPNQYKFGMDYTKAKTGVDLSDNGIGIDDLDTDLWLARLDYGIHEKTDLCGRIGFAEIEDLGNKLAWAVGIKSTIMESPDLDWGGLIQITSTTGSGSGLKIDMFEIQLAVGPMWRMNEAVNLYGGPFLHWISGEIERRRPGTPLSSDIEQESFFGVYAGIAIWATNQGEFHFEYQKTADADAVGFGMLFRF